MKFGLMTSECRLGPTGGNGWDSILAQARLAEAVGFDSVWFPDHFISIELFGKTVIPALAASCASTPRGRERAQAHLQA
jgi:alkanesulfonate monooxygenase SsuD/methylene tetrahydromethanopterin reductase-like flavin-dependent oxidoreductase (luciferase family)